jgi:undecaprenyl-diphosphatase
MEIYGQVALLGVIQGLTEFFPVSSSGHLILAQHFMGLAEAGVLVDVILHAGTLLAVLLFLRQEIAMILSGLFRRGEAGQEGRRLIWLTLLASLPTALIGLAFRPVFEDMFQSIAVVGLGLVLTSLILLLTRVWPNKNKFDLRTMPCWLALLVGLVQALVFMLLCAVYTQLSAAHEEGEAH